MRGGYEGEPRDGVYKGVGLEHTALITWSASREAEGLPSVQQFIQPAWLGEGGQEDEGWSLVCRFDDVPLDQGNPSTAFVRFLVADAPHEYLQPGAVLRLFDGDRDARATVRILD